MHVLFVHCAVPGVPFNSSIAALSGYLKQHGHTTSLLVLRDGVSTEEVHAALRADPCEVVAFSYMTSTSERATKWIREVRTVRPDVRIISGGAHTTLYPDQALAETEVDAICVGEGEEPLRLWMEDPHTAHPGILRKGHNDVLQRWWFPNPTDLPDWDRGLFGDCTNAGNRYEEAVGVALARGFCPFTCTFCGVDAYRRANKQPTSGAMRLREPRAVIDEMKRALDIIPVPQGFSAWDEILPLQRKWLAEFFELYRAEIGLPFAGQARIEQVNPKFVEILAKGGCDYLVIGVESGDENYRKRFLDKRFTNEQAIRAFQLLREAGITVFCSFMIGLPFETPSMLAKTLRLARQLQAHELSWKFYTPERGTKLIELCEQHNLLIPKYVDSPFGGHEPMIKMPNCRKEDIDKTCKAFEILRKQTKPGTFERWNATEQKPRPVLEHRGLPLVEGAS